MGDSDGQVKAGAASVDPVQFGILLGKVDIILTKLDDIDKKYATREQVEEIKRRLEHVEKRPGKLSAKAIAIGAMIFSGMTGIGSMISAWKAWHL